MRPLDQVHQSDRRLDLNPWGGSQASAREQAFQVILSFTKSEGYVPVNGTLTAGSYCPFLYYSPVSGSC